MVKVLGITQARIGSSRLPGKVLLEVNGKTLLQYHLERASKAATVEKWIIATTHEPGAEQICKIGAGLNIGSFQGNLTDVLERFFQAASAEKPAYVVRITSDCPLIDPSLIDAVVNFTIDNQLNYCITSTGLPDGVDVEVMTFGALENAFYKATLASDREHVTSYIRRKAQEEQSQFSYRACETDYSDVRITIDEQADMEAFRTLLSNLGAGKGWKEYAEFVIANPLLFSNQKIIRNEGFLKSIKNDETPTSN